MQLFYIDEAEGVGRTEHDDIYILGTIILDEVQLRTVESELRELAVNFLKGKSPLAFEFHGYEIYQGRGPFKGVPPDDRIAIVEAMLEIAEKNGVKFGYSCIRKRQCFAKMHPHQLAFLVLAERIEDTLKHEKELGLIVADENPAMEQRLVEDLELFKIADTNFGWRPTKIEHVVDSIHFVRSKNNRTIQLADVATTVALHGISDQAAAIDRFIHDPDPKNRPPLMLWPAWLESKGSLREKANIRLWNRLQKNCRIAKSFPS